MQRTHSSQVSHLIIAWLLSHSIVLSGQTCNTFLRDSLDRYITTAMDRWNIPGLAVAIIKDDTLVYAKGFGVTELGSLEQVNTSTLFPIWSMGKSFTAFGLALLEARHALNLDDPVKQHYPAFRMADKTYERAVTITDLLAHRIGIETFHGDFLWSESTLNTPLLLRKWAKLQPAYPLRSGFQYSNFGYLIAGEVLEQVCKKNWQDFITQEILIPTGMKNSVLYPDQLRNRGNIANCHVKVMGKIKPIGANINPRIEAFGGMYSNVEDMIHWLRLHLNKGILDNTQVFEAGIFERVHRPQSIVGKIYIPDGSSSWVNYALGWEVRDYRHREVLTHGGAYKGFASMMGFVPQEKLGFVILSNSDPHELGEALKWQIIDAYLNTPYQNYFEQIYQYTRQAEAWEAQKQQSMQDSVALHLAPTVPLTAFEGVYSNDVYGNVKIVTKGPDMLKLCFEHHPKLEATLQHVGDNRFWATYSEAMFGQVLMPFRIKNDKVLGFALTVHPSVEFTAWQFNKN